MGNLLGVYFTESFKCTTSLLFFVTFNDMLFYIENFAAIFQHGVQLNYFLIGNPYFLNLNFNSILNFKTFLFFGVFRLTQPFRMYSHNKPHIPTHIPRFSKPLSRFEGFNSWMVLNEKRSGSFPDAIKAYSLFCLASWRTCRSSGYDGLSIKVLIFKRFWRVSGNHYCSICRSSADGSLPN